MMKTVTIPSTDIKISVIGMGCWAISGDMTWGTQSKASALEAIHAALSEGINFFDTAELYGNGISEEILGEALRGKREKAIVASKFNVEHSRFDQVIKACEQSLRRLKSEWIDLYQIHWRNRTVPLHETWDALLKLQQQGKIRAIGICNFGVNDLDQLLKLGKPVTNQLPYSLLFRSIEYEILPKCVKEGIGVLCYSPLAMGLLTGKFSSPDQVPITRARTRHYSWMRPLTRHHEAGCEADCWAAIREIANVADELGVSLVELAIAWILHQPGVLAVICGIRTKQQACINSRAVQLKLPEPVLKRLDSITQKLKIILGANPDMWEGQQNSRIR